MSEARDRYVEARRIGAVALKAASGFTDLVSGRNAPNSQAVCEYVGLAILAAGARPAGDREPSERAIAAAADAGLRWGVALSDSGYFNKIEAILAAAYAVDFGAAPAPSGQDPPLSHSQESTMATAQQNDLSLADRHAAAMRAAHLAYFDGPNAGPHQPEPYADWMAKAEQTFWQDETGREVGG